MAKKEAIEGGVSDPRNGVVLKIFSLINYGGLTDKMSDKQSLKDKIRRKLSDKTKMPSKMSDKLSDIVVLAFSNESITTSMVVLRLAIDERNARRYLTRLVDLGYLTAEGENRNKKYRYKKDAGTDSCTE